MIRAVIFDLGGTLLEFNPQHLPWLDWEQDGLESARAYLVSRGYDLPREAFAASFVETLPERWEQAVQGGPNLRLGDVLREACLACGVTPAAQELEQAIAHYIAPLDARVAMYDDSPATLDVLRGRGYKIGLISNTMWPGSYHRRQLERCGLLPYFDHTLFSADAGVWKPQPGIYRLALDALGVPAGEAVFVGDTSRYDVAGALGAGMRAVYKRHDERPDDGIHLTPRSPTWPSCCLSSHVERRATR